MASRACPGICSRDDPAARSKADLLNALYGSGMMTLLGILIGSPIGGWPARISRSMGATRVFSTVIRSSTTAAERAFDHHRLFVYEIVVFAWAISRPSPRPGALPSWRFP